mmetsp:Transcript_39639/g.47649  ORF Transcript_39639/g.47649 Transcript_39639/m.47649 type:complete len:91 (+) Transcript_39639:857-1129(+)
MARQWLRNVSLLEVVVVMATIGLGGEVAAKVEGKEQVAAVEVVVVGVEGDRPSLCHKAKLFRATNYESITFYLLLASVLRLNISFSQYVY